MGYVGVGRALSAVEATALDRGVFGLPACYSAELDNCINNELGPKVANCDVISAGYAADEAKMEAAVRRIPFCPAPAGVMQAGMGMKGLAAVGAIALSLGVVVGLKIK